jgi:hypothetical protein
MTTVRESNEFTVEQASKLREHVVDQMKQHTEASIALAKALFETRWGTIKGSATKLVEAWGFPDFETFAEKALLMHGGTAKSYARVYDELCVKRNFAEGELPPSITALRELARVSRKIKDQRELHRWLKLSKTSTACEFKHEVEREVYGRKGRVRDLHFAMKWAVATRCMDRLREARERYGLKTNGEAFERIMNEHTFGKRTTSEIRGLRRAS